jgi:hypothetical protein
MKISRGASELSKFYIIKSPPKKHKNRTMMSKFDYFQYTFIPTRAVLPQVSYASDSDK